MPHLISTIDQVLCLGIMFFYLVFGCFGKIGTSAFSKIKIQILTWPKKLWIVPRSIFFYANNSLVMTKRTIPKSIKWEKPRAGWLTLNIDVSTTSNSGSVGRGGLIRDEKGDRVTGFVRRIANTTSFMAEL